MRGGLGQDSKAELLSAGGCSIAKCGQGSGWLMCLREKPSPPFCNLDPLTPEKQELLGFIIRLLEVVPNPAEKAQSLQPDIQNDLNQSSRVAKFQAGKGPSPKGIRTGACTKCSSPLAFSQGRAHSQSTGVGRGEAPLPKAGPNHEDFCKATSVPRPTQI